MAAYYTRREYERQQRPSGTPSPGSSTGTFCSLLTLLLIGLKLTGHFSHSWWLVWAPIWGPCASYLVLAVIATACSAAAELLYAYAARKRRAKAAEEAAAAESKL